jgi:hypothetical protein
MSVEVDYGQWGPITLAAGQSATWWFTWGFDANHWSVFDAAPDNYPASIMIVQQWAEKNISGGTVRWVTWKNNGATPVQFRPRVIQAPSRW